MTQVRHRSLEPLLFANGPGIRSIQWCPQLKGGAQALAFIEGRSFCVPDDCKRLFVPVFAHRVVINPRYASTLRKGDLAAAILQEIVDSTEVPL